MIYALVITMLINAGGDNVQYVAQDDIPISTCRLYREFYNQMFKQKGIPGHADCYGRNRFGEELR